MDNNRWIKPWTKVSPLYRILCRTGSMEAVGVLPISQSTPAYPIGHSQVAEDVASSRRHIPPFWQGQMSVSRKIGNISIRHSNKR